MNARQFCSAAEARFQAATVLQAQRWTGTDAVYLAGYAVECSLKALILQRTPRSRIGDLLNSVVFQSAKGHDLEALLHYLTNDCGENIPVEVVRDIRRVARRWSVRLRYNSRKASRRESARFLTDVEQIAAWVAWRVT